MTLECQDLEHVFDWCFFVDYQTVLAGGGVEPLYLPSDDASSRPHRAIYREDYDYWYSPDGRDSREQIAFEKVEARPQALEWIFSDACEFSFHLSADNLTLGRLIESR